MIPRNGRPGAHDDRAGVITSTDRHDEYASDPGNLNR
ncbi:hypothetical protein Ae168Ps1_3523c [Pseudonocardia sp. Ae168_Ps1]|nr:hypothetical protein Ae150APs1_3500c [Pseudonocardia sp. Ae150A_Ps1]OLL81117.1 hypothetical protein Ae168Ps1_3523c [Pseudonocardia sp. Ae168_Ps1]OLL84769.1 hypothetical protein Ae263Ps1_1824 [Pseudonocardia sp. Ae263_Ps1]OLL95214.1 hypothetical protein Ae356Ps1_5111c [Pseudonocardia sp. Ae356_Ps1]